MSSLQKEVLKQHLPPPPFPVNQSHSGRKRDYSPLPWSNFFDECKDVPVGTNTFRVYSKGDTSSGPVLMLLHGGGHSALSWACFTVEVTKLVQCCVIAVDIRGHGHTITNDDTDLSSDTLINDISGVFDSLFSHCDSPPPTVLMGHSMGGAIAVRVAAANGIPSLVGLAVIDIVEGTAMASLAGMQSFLRSRPQSFNSLEHAIEWSIRSGQLKNRTSARVSMPGQVKQSGGATGAVCIEQLTKEKEGDGEHESPAQSSLGNPSEYTWRIDLTKTECHWKDWFVGLSNLFLRCTTEPKILILAGVDRLDKDLTIGQMQGKFQMQVMQGCGHAVHEDSPEKVAEVVSRFLTIFKLSGGWCKRTND